MYLTKSIEAFSGKIAYEACHDAKIVNSVRGRRNSFTDDLLS